MIDHFNAFISYKHADLDNRIAASIVRDLERFHIPRKIQKATGVKKIDRIFRDKDELPITSDLNDTISMALHNADFLIVICSTNTKLSAWVEREIEVFLQNHTMDRILTVLADGEPGEVIPKVLLSGKKEVVDENGVTHVVEMPFEPLSCDYRIPYRRAKAEELPRMAAALIGCSYDELINRHRQYKMRRMMAISGGAIALSLGFAGYMLYSNARIHENYLESLKNQSRYLANQSERLLGEENRIEAMQLALEALPKEEGDERPVTPEAIKAITNSCRAYVALMGSNLDSVWNYRMPNRVTAFKLSEKSVYLAGIDENGVVIVWDTKTHKQALYENTIGDMAEEFFFFGDEKLIIKCDESLRAYDLTRGGKEIWKLQDDEDTIRFASTVFAYSEDSILVPGKMGTIHIISMNDGAIKKSYQIMPDDSDGYLYFTGFALSEDKKKLAGVLAVKDDAAITDYKLYEYDLESERLTASEEALDGVVFDIIYSEDNIYLACGSQINKSGMMFGYSFVTEGHTAIKCISSGDLSLKWESDFACYDMSENIRLLPLAGGKIAYVEGDSCMVWNAKTGEVLDKYDTNDTIVDISDKDNDGIPLFITQGGATGSPTDIGDAKGVSLNTILADNLINARVSGGVYALQYMSRDIIYYTTKVYDEDWTQIEGVPSFKSSSDYYMDDDILALINSGTETPELLFVDPGSKTFKGSVPLKENTLPYQYKLLGTVQHTFYVVYLEDGALAVIKVDLDTMKADTEIIDEDYKGYEPVCEFKNSQLIYYDSEDLHEYFAVKRDVVTGKETQVTFEGKPFGLSYDAENDCAYLMADKTYEQSAKTDLLVNFADGTFTEIEVPHEWEVTTIAAMSPKGDKIAATDSENIRILKKNGELIGEISCQNVRPLGMSFFDDMGKELLLVVYENGTLSRYEADTAQFTGKTDITVSTLSTLYSAGFEHDAEQGLLYVQVGNNMDVVETDTFVEVAKVVGCFGHHKATDTFITSAFEDTSYDCMMGYFEHYSVDRLIQKTRDHLQGEEMSEDQKSMYGIGG